MLVFFTDLDGTLLDRHTFSHEAARPALDRLAQRSIPVVFCTSKTRAEVEVLRERIGNAHPFIVENGGAILIPTGYFPFEASAERRDGYEIIEFGDCYPVLVEALRQAAEETGCDVLGFQQMSDQEVGARCDLPLPDAALARRREYGEAFLILTLTRTARLLEDIVRRGKRWTRGDRCYHIMGANDKAIAVRTLAELYRRAHGAVRTVGLGDAPNDAEFLQTVDTPIIVRSPHSRELGKKTPRAKRTRLQGPEGWNEAVLEVLSAL
jgi:mannosyl-3-phosphoglycerate phosphatase